MIKARIFRLAKHFSIKPWKFTSYSGPTEPPEAPTGLTATGDYDEIDLAWTAPSGATSYKIYRAEVTGGPYDLIDTSGTNSYSDESAVVGTEYFYVVKASNSGGDSDYSNEDSAVAVDSDMVLTVDTSLEAGEQVTLPLYGTVNCTVDWGDGSSNEYTTTGDKTHTYSSGGIYTIRISGTLTQFGNSYNGYANSLKITGCTSFGNIGLTSLDGAFMGSSVTVMPSILPSTVTILDHCFRSAALFNSDISGWGANGVISFWLMFYQSPFNQPLPNFVTNSAISLSAMFRETTAFNQSVASWDTSSVTAMPALFKSASAFQGDGVSSFRLDSISHANNLGLEFAIGTAFTTANLDATLIQWNIDKNDYRSDINVSFGTTKYSSGDAKTAHDALVAYGWTIVSGGEDT